MPSNDPRRKEMYNAYWSNWYRGKRSFLRETFADKIVSLLHPEKILDVGCGPGHQLRRFLRLKQDAYAVEYSNWMIANQLRDLAQQQRVMEGSILDIPYPDSYFDFIMCVEVLEHIAAEDIEQAVQELVRVSSRYVFCTTCPLTSPLDKPGAVDKLSEWQDFKVHETVHEAQWWVDLFARYGGTLNIGLTQALDEKDQLGSTTDFHLFEVRNESSIL